MVTSRCLSVLVIFATLASPQAPYANTAKRQFSLTMKRTSGLEASPSYRITIHDDGTAEYEGFISVQVEGIRKTQLSHAAVQKLIHKLQAERFFDWEEKDYVCIDLPEVEISAVLDGKTKRVIEGCQEAGGVLDLADEIDRITGVKRWVGKVWLRGFAKEK